MYRFFVEPEQIGEETISITGSDVNHIKNVLRMRMGENIWISDGKEKEYHCEIVEMDSDVVRAKILDVDGAQTELPAEIYLFQGLPKGDKMELIIQKAVELGVHAIIPMSTERTIVKLDQKKEASKLKRWNAISESAAKQSKRMLIPEVRPVMSFAKALEYVRDFDIKVIPYEEAVNTEETRQIIDQIRPGQKICIFIGPEGGFGKQEVEKAKEAGLCPVTLGKRILRTETAGMMLLSVMMFELETGEKKWNRE